MSRDEVVRSETFPDEPNVSKRVYRTLTRRKSVQDERLVRAVARLTHLLHDHGLMSDQDVNELLFEVAVYHGRDDDATRR